MAKLTTETCLGMPDGTSKDTSGLLSCPVHLIKFSNVVRSPEGHLTGQFFSATHYQVYLPGMTVSTYLTGIPDSVWPA